MAHDYLECVVCFAGSHLFILRSRLFLNTHTLTHSYRKKVARKKSTLEYKIDYDENPNINTQTPQVHYASSTPRRKQQDYGVFWPWAKKRNANSKKQNSNPSATIKWYYLDSNKTKRGPLSTHAIQDLRKSQYIKLDSYVWNTEMCTWKRACQVAPLQKVILRTQAARERETKYVVVLFEPLTSIHILYTLNSDTVEHNREHPQELLLRVLQRTKPCGTISITRDDSEVRSPQQH